MPFEEYFGYMDLTLAQKNRRIALAQTLEDLFMDFLIAIALLTDNEIYEVGFLESEYLDKLLDVLSGYDIDTHEQKHFKNLIQEVAEVTLRHIDDMYYTSQDRARFIAENESNTYWNYEEFQQAIADGYTQKTWHTMLDDRVRMSHELVEFETVPITEPFIVGSSQMMYPKDDSLGAPPEEIINCRCSVSYM